jgi:hypothetical protein
MPPRRVAVAILLAIAALAIGLVPATGATARRPPPPVPPGVSIAPPGPLPERDAGAARAEPRDSEAAPGRMPVGPGAPVTITVCDAAGLPMPEASLRLEYRSGQFVHRATVRAPARARDDTVRTDARGQVLLEDAPTSGFWLVGLRGDLTGIVELDPAYFGRAAPPPLVMLPSRPVEVTVRDRNGAAVPGISVEARETLCVSRARAVTDDDGIARFEVTCIDRRLYEAAEVGVTVHSGFPHPTWPPPVRWAERGPTRLAVVVDPVPVVRVVVDGDAGTDRVARTLSWEAPGSGGSTLPWWTGLPAQDFVGGRTAIGGLPPDADVVLTLAEPGRRPSKVTITTPGRGETREVVIGRGVPAARLRVRVIEAPDVPLSGVRVIVETRPGPGALPDFLADTETDAAGRFDFEVAPETPGDFVLRRCDLTLFAGLVHPALQPGEARDVTVTFAPARVVARGVVIDAAGAPVEGAVVTLAEGAPPAGRATTRITGPDGTFTFRGAAASPIAIRAHDPAKGSSDWIPLEVPAPPVALELAPCGALVGRLRAAPGLPRLPMTVTIEPSDRAGQKISCWPPPPEWRTAPVPDGGAFALAGLPRGPYDVRVHLGEVLVLSAPRVDVPAGQDGSDPRLDDVVVGEGLRDAVVHVRDAAGAPVADAGVVLLECPDAPAGTAPWQRRTTGADGAARFLVPRGAAVAVCVTRGGAVPFRRSCSEFPFTVTIAPQVDLPVVVTSEGRLPTTDQFTRYCLCLTRVGEDPPGSAGLPREHRAWFAPTSTSFTVSNVNPGEYEVSLAPSGMHVGGLGAWSFETPEWLALGHVSVAGHEDRRPVELRVPLAECRRLLGLAPDSR